MARRKRRNHSPLSESKVALAALKGDKTITSRRYKMNPIYPYLLRGLPIMWPDLHIGPEQAIEARVALGSGLFIPVHWGTFNLAMHAWTEPVERALVTAEKAGVPTAVPRPGENIEPVSPPQLTRWWPSIPWKTAKQEPIVSSGIEQSPRMASEPSGGVR